MNIFSKGPGKTEFIMKFVQAIMSQRRLVNFLMYCACDGGIVKHMPSPDLVTEDDGCRITALFHRGIVWGTLV